MIPLFVLTSELKPLELLVQWMALQEAVCWLSIRRPDFWPWLASELGDLLPGKTKALGWMVPAISSPLL